MDREMCGSARDRGRSKTSDFDPCVARPFGGCGRDAGVARHARSVWERPLIGAMPYGKSGAGPDRMVGEENG